MVVFVSLFVPLECPLPSPHRLLVFFESSWFLIEPCQGIQRDNLDMVDHFLRDLRTELGLTVL